jgi:hypothetical protein
VISSWRAKEAHVVDLNVLLFDIILTLHMFEHHVCHIMWYNNIHVYMDCVNLPKSLPVKYTQISFRRLTEDIMHHKQDLLYNRAHLVILTAGKVPVTVVVAGDVIYIAQENFHHWPLPRLQELPPKEALDPPFSSVERKDINDIEQIVSYREQAKSI